MPKIFLVCDGSLPEILTKTLGPHWLRVVNGTGLEAAKVITREAGGANNKRESWNLVQLGAEDEEAIMSLASSVREALRDHEEMAIPLESLMLPLYLLEEVARRSSATLVLGAVFHRDPDATWDESVS
jgi:hypothetical protein